MPGDKGSIDQADMGHWLLLFICNTVFVEQAVGGTLHGSPIGDSSVPYLVLQQH